MIPRSTRPMQWRKSSYSANAGGQCLEVARDHDFVWIRDSKHVASGMLGMDTSDWNALIALARDHR